MNTPYVNVSVVRNNYLHAHTGSLSIVVMPSDNADTIPSPPMTHHHQPLHTLHQHPPASALNPVLGTNSSCLNYVDNQYRPGLNLID